MTNNIRKIKQDLRAYAKRCKDVHYTESLLITFLITGMLFMAGNLFSAPSDASIENQRQAISDSIKTINQQVKTARKENDKLLKNTTLELIQLMEQGDHVIKSPWSSWQYGENFFNNNWNGTYKGRGDKQAKYPYEGVFQRGEWWERNVTPTGYAYNSLNHGEANPYSATTTKRNGLALNGYGLLNRDEIIEPTNELELGASIRPKAVTRTPVAVAVPAGPSGTGPALPNVSIPKFNPAAPEIHVPTPGTAPTFNIELGSFCNSMCSTSSQNGMGLNFVGTDGSRYGVGRSITGNTSAGGLAIDNPSLRYSWAANPYRLFKVYFDTDGHTVVDQDLTIDSKNPLNNNDRNYERNTKSRPFNAQSFLVGGSRVGTLDNAGGRR